MDQPTGSAPPPTWLELMLLMVYGPGRTEGVDIPDPSLRGTIRSLEGQGLPRNATDWAVISPARLPAVTGARQPDDSTEVRVWRDGERVRVERADGSLTFITDGTTTWTFDDDGTVTASTGRRTMYAGHGTHLVSRREATDYLGDDFTRPTGAVTGGEHLGRPAWVVELAPPPRKPLPLEVVVDAATGLLLEQNVRGAGASDSWVELAVGEELDPSLFTWTGPVRSLQDQQQQSRDQHEDERAAGDRWWREHVALQQRSARVEADLDLTLGRLHTREDDGSFEASLGEGQNSSLARRPRSDAPWNLRWYGEPAPHRWSTQRWDWAFRAHDLLSTERLRLTDDGFAAVESCFADE